MKLLQDAITRFRTMAEFFKIRQHVGQRNAALGKCLGKEAQWFIVFGYMHRFARLEAVG